MESTERYKLLALLVVLVASIVGCPTSLFAATRSTTTKGTATLLYWTELGPLPFPYPMEVTTRATYTAKYDSRTRKTFTNVSQTDQSVLLKGARNSPCGLEMAVTTTVFENRRSEYRTMTRTSSGSKNGSYLVSSSSLITGFINTRAFSLIDPRLETRGSVAGRECMGQKTLTNRLDLP